jgi:methyl-accepting chemotaxis protein
MPMRNHYKHVALLAVLVLQLALVGLSVPSWLGVLLVTIAAAACLYWPTVDQSKQGPSEKEVALTEMAAGVAQATSKMATGAAEVSFYIDGLVKDIRHSGDDCAHIVTASDNLTTTSGELSGNLQTISKTIHQTSTACETADSRLQGGVSNLTKLTLSISNAADQLQQLRSSADNIQRITEVINGVAEQTNLLALNAAIEAARAGDQGRGFAVVAEEVRALAGKTSTATQDIAKMLSDIHKQSQAATALMSDLEAASGDVKQELQQVAEVFNEINLDLSKSSSALGHIEQASSGLEETSGQISQSISNINQALDGIQHKTANIGDRALEVSNETEIIYSDLARLHEEIFFMPILEEAERAASAISQLFEKALSEGKLNHSQLFSEKYVPIPNTDPQKYHTDYDRFTDDHLPAIQEPILVRHSNILYAGAVDRKGYFPTHNRKYSQPLTGNYERDLVNNRGKRIFEDRTGRRSGANTQPMLLQTYKRDTGEILHDLSVPIIVKGKHWGGFRIGFKRVG